MAGMNDILAHADDLPAFPAVVARAAAILVHPDSGMADVEKIVRQDEALAAAVLKRGNSARYGAAGKAFNLQQSLARLGRLAALELVTSVKISSYLERAGETYGLRRRALWQGSLFGAICAEKIARDTGHADAGTAYLCGLMRDIGKIAIDWYCAKTSCGVLAAAGAATGDFMSSERLAFGVDHAELGAELARRWGLPEPVPSAILYHHNPPPEDAPEHNVLFDIVHAADILCLATGLGVGYDGLKYRLAPHVRKLLLASHQTAAEYTAHTWAELSAIEPDLSKGAPREQTA